MARQYNNYNRNNNYKSNRSYRKPEVNEGKKLYSFIGGLTQVVDNANDSGREHRYDESLDNSYGRRNINNFNRMQEERRSSYKLGKYVAVDCEFVGSGYKGSQSELGRVSIVNYHGNVVYDTYVKPDKPVTDYRTKYSGLRPQDIKNGVSFETAREQVKNIVEGRVLVGHSIKNDLDVLKIHHDDVRDTAQLPSYKAMNGGQKPSLKFLSENVLNKEIQRGEHSSVEDAAATMELYKAKKRDFEEYHRSR